jgi:sugar phosphate isomerase/epimerase
MRPQFALSTIWRWRRFETLKDFFEAANKLGATHFELDRSISLREISSLSLPEGQISSLEIPCPAHPQTHSAKFASLNRYERSAARQAAQNSFDLAVDVQAKVVLLNLGRVELDHRLEKALRHTWQKSGPHADAFQSLRHELVTERARKAAPHLEALFYDLEFLASEALKRNLTLGLLTPTWYTDLGLPEELFNLLEEFSPVVQYWHDVAHAHIFDRLTLLPQSEWLAVCGLHLQGARLHDVQDLQAWLVPQKENGLDFNTILPQLTACTHISCLFAGHHSAEAVEQAWQNLQAKFKALTSNN